MKIKAKFKGHEMEFLTHKGSDANYLPALGSDLRLYHFLKISRMGELTRQSALAGEKGYVDKDRLYCFVICEPDSGSRVKFDMRHWNESNNIEDFLKFNGIKI